MSRSYLCINIGTPFVKVDRSKVVGSKSWFDVHIPFTKFQNMSLDTFGFTPTTLVNIELEYTGRDYNHAGFMIVFGCTFFEFILQWYDSRHVDDEE